MLKKMGKVIPICTCWLALMVAGQVLNPEAGLAAVSGNTQAAVTNDLQGMEKIEIGPAVKKYAPFRLHLKNVSRLVRRTDASLLHSGKSLPISSIRTIRVALDRKLGRLPQYQLAAPLASLISDKQTFSIIAAMEESADFKAAALVGMHLIDSAPAGVYKDLLSLVTARNIFLSRDMDFAPQYNTCLETAKASTQPEIAYHALLWLKAVGSPSEPESLLLCQQIYETVVNDSQNILDAYKLSYLIGVNGPKAYWDAKKSSRPEGIKQALLGRIVSCVSEAGFQAQQPNWIAWAEEYGKDLPLANQEDVVSVAYFRGLYHYSLNQFGLAKKHFEKAFISGAVCDIAAEAGYYNAICYDNLNDTIAAQASLEAIREAYPQQVNVLKHSSKLLEDMMKRNFGRDTRQVSQLKAERYHTILARSEQKPEKTIMVAKQD